MVKCPVCLTEQASAPNCGTCGAPMRAAATDAVNPYAAPVIGEPIGTTESHPQFAPLARRLIRLAAQFVDGLITLAAVVPGLILMIVGHAFETEPFGAADLQPLAIVGVVIAGIAVLALTIYQWVLLSRDGQTLGKKALGLKVVRHDDGRNPGFGRAVALRLWVNGLIGAVPYCGSFYSLIDLLFIFGHERRCIHDYIAGTKVIEVT